MLATLIPLFDGNSAVCAYSLFAQKQNYLRNPSMLGTGSLDGAGTILGLEVVESLGAGTLADNQEVFVELSKISIFSPIEENCSMPHEKVVLLFDHTIPADQTYIKRLQQLKFMNYKLAIRKLAIEQFEEYAPILGLLDYIMLDYKKINMVAARNFFSKVYPDIKLIAVNVDSIEDYEELAKGGAYSLYEGDFYRLPVTKGSTKVAPLKVNYIELLKIVNNPDFELTKAADIIGRDTALVIELLRMVNHMAINSEITSIRHAAAMLGQKELKKWINAVVSHELCADKPNEITRLSLLRAKFAENLAPTFEMAALSSELFLMGLFSVLDIILDKPMKEALQMVNVSKEITEALVERKGDLAKVFEFITCYEIAQWSELSRQMIVYNINEAPVYDAYVEALAWYRDLFGTAQDSKK
ncbi:MAG: HDOD domain-containing protein [Lachnospiraceae bacterium]|nr:HDOD domain-containing protein [Lachnospiraceae bacterium]